MSIAFVVIAVNVAVSLYAFPALHSGIRREAEAFLFVPYQVARGENWTGMLLAHFAHASVWHLALNLFTLYSFAGRVLDGLGTAQFLLIYVVAGLGAHLMVFSLRIDDPTYGCLGASGSIAGIVMAAIVLDPRTSVAFFPVPIPIPGPLFMLGYAILTAVLVAQGHRGGISHEAHLGGAIAGLAAAGVLAPHGLGPLARWFVR